MRAWWVVLGAGLLVGCPARRMPTGPPPEYEPPTVIPWDAEAPTDPFAEMEGEAVTDDEPEAEPDAGAEADAAGDGAAPDGGLGPPPAP